MKILIKIDTDINSFINFINQNNINVYDIKVNNNYILCYINNNDLDILNKYYIIDVIKNYSFNYILNYIKNNIIKLLFILFGIIIFIILSNVIVDVKIDSNNTLLVNELSKSLDKYSIKRLSFKKNYIELNNIKNIIKEEFKDKIEWIEINNIGMTYNISFEVRKNKLIDSNNNLCDIVAFTSGTVSKIISSKGVVLTKVNKSVNEGDILISGHIMLNDIDKESVCASGKVYAERWYSVSIEVPKKYLKKEYTNHFKYNLLYEDNNEYKIFKSRYKNYDTDKKEIISILGRKLYLLKEYEYKLNEYEYDEESLNKKIDDLIFEKLELSLNDEEKIISKNILKKDENDSKIEVDIFVIVEKLISKQIIY